MPPKTPNEPPDMVAKFIKTMVYRVHDGDLRCADCRTFHSARCKNYEVILHLARLAYPEWMEANKL